MVTFEILFYSNVYNLICISPKWPPEYGDCAVFVVYSILMGFFF